MTAPVATLSLVGDGDDLDIICDLERSFGVDFGTGPLNWTTVGDIEDHLLALYPAAATTGVCASAMAFRRLRAALPGERRIMRPDTPLAWLIPRGTALGLQRDFQSNGLDVPLRQLDRAARIGCLLALVGVPGLCLCLPLGFYGLGLVLLVMAGSGILLVKHDRGDPADMTLGALAKATADRNFAAFAARGADCRVEAIRAALLRIVGAHTGIDPHSIGRETRVLG